MSYKAIEDWKKPEHKFGRTVTEQEMVDRTHQAWPYLFNAQGEYHEPELIDEIIVGALDIHLHGAPLGNWLKGRPPMEETCIQASQAGMKALVFKDHNTMCNNCAIIIQNFLKKMQKDAAAKGEVFTPVEVFGGLTLNETVGGINPKAVKVALGYGRCKEIWLPSLDAGYQQEAMGRTGGLYVANGAELTKEMIEVLDVMADYNNNTKGDVVALSTCHVSNEEKFAILDYVNKKGMNIKVIMDHVTQEMTLLTREEALEMIDKGAYLEFAETSCIEWPAMLGWIINYDYSMYLIKELLKERGPEQLVLITDAGQPNHEPVPGLKNFVRTLWAQGVSREHIEIMLKDVPAMLIGLD